MKSLTDDDIGDNFAPHCGDCKNDDPELCRVKEYDADSWCHCHCHLVKTENGTVPFNELDSAITVDSDASQAKPAHTPTPWKQSGMRNSD